jgi:hypothetical protein
MSNLTAVNPITGATDALVQGLADPVGMKLLHMITADPARTPSFVMFGDPNYFFFAGAPNCNAPCVALPSPAGSVFAWNHGDDTAEISNTWLGLVGPGVGKSRIDSKTWSDHTDVRPTILTLVGLQDPYGHDGRLLVEGLEKWAIPAAAGKATFSNLAEAYKQINAPFGTLGVNALKVSTAALTSDDSNDATYQRLSGEMSAWTSQRDGLAALMKALLNGAAFDNMPIDDQTASLLVNQAKDLQNEVERAVRLLNLK